MKFLGCILSIISLTSFAFAADNYDLTGRWGVGVGAGMTNDLSPSAFTEGANELDGGFLGSLWARYHFNKRMGMELSYSRLNFDYANAAAPLSNGDAMSDLVMVNATYRAWPERQLRMLWQLGLGYARNKDLRAAGGKDDFVVGARVGGEYMATPDLALGLNADFHRINLGGGPSSHLSVLSPMLSLTYYFGGFSGGAKAVGDQDADGIADNLDKCADTPSGARVGSDGCPIKASKTDSDGDGVNDTEDKCPGTPAGQKVTEYGCAETDKIEITLNVRFATGSSKIDKSSLADLDKFGEFMVKYANTNAEIEGHTDNTGNEKLNYRISQKRADSVREYLTKKFGLRSRLTAKGYGPSQPVADNAKPEGREQNRRVVAHVMTESKAK